MTKKFKLLARLFKCFVFLCFFCGYGNVIKSITSDSVVLNTCYSSSQSNSIEKPKKTLKALVVYSSTSYFLYRGEIMGFEYELLERLARKLNMDLEIVLSQNIDSLIPDLLSGKADLIAHGMTITDERRYSILFTDPLYISHQVLIQKKPDNWHKMNKSQFEENMVRYPRKLVGDTVFVRENSSYKNQLEVLNANLGGGIVIQALDGSYSTDKIIDLVNKGIIKYTIADANLAKINTVNMLDLDIDTSVSNDQEIAWAVRPDSQELLNAINQQLKVAKKNTDYYVIYNKYFKNRSYYKKRLKSSYYSIKHDKISPYDDIIKKEAERIDWDWRLLSSLIYQESRFNPAAESWSGAVGLMQIMPVTAKAHGLEDPTNPNENIKAGATYLQQIYNQFKDIESKEQRIKFTIASYNSGYGHILDAQRLADIYKKDKHIWDNNVELMMLELGKPEVYHKPEVKHGYARGVETYNYVKEIFQRYDNYTYFIKY